AGIEPDTEKAVEWLRKAADAGESGAYAELGMLYINGEGVEQDLEEGGRWLLRSAESGDALSQFKVGYMYEEGEGFEKDLLKAYGWYEKAAEQELPDALFKVATMICDGVVEKDDIKAMEYYTRSARLGFVPAIFNLGVMLFTRCEYDDAYKWFQNGAFRNDPDCQFYFGRMYIEGKGVKRDIGQGVKWLRLSAKNGNKMAQEVIDRVESESR
ncbi:MAG: sel1 repeat family protein, partial [Candidatus Methanomethylophilaceae archaeon]|nr:sel1 repeat family protein [Candidatus Methanomethylophilaceae archaeon]